MTVSFSSINFRGNKSISKKDNSKVVLNKDNAKEIFSDKKLRNGFLAGTIAGILMTAGVSSHYSNEQSKKVLEDMKENLDNKDYEEIEIKDVTDDNTPDIILRDKSGDEDIYDVKSNKIYVKVDNKVIDKADLD